MEGGETRKVETDVDDDATAADDDDDDSGFPLSQLSQLLPRKSCEAVVIGAHGQARTTIKCVEQKNSLQFYSSFS